MSRITTVQDKIPQKASWPGFLASGKDSRTKVVLARKLEKQGLGSIPDSMKKNLFWAGVVPSPCFSYFLARTTFVLESLPEAKNPGQDAIFGDFVFNSFEYVWKDVRLIQPTHHNLFWVYCLFASNPPLLCNYILKWSVFNGFDV